MALETGSVVNDLVTTNPTASDAKSQGDDHLRLIKTAVKNSFPGFTGAVIVGGTSTGAVNAYVLSAAMQSYVANTLVVWTPSITNTDATTININGLGYVAIKRVDGAPTLLNDLIAGQYAVMAYTGTEFRIVGVTKSYIDSLSFASSLPAQTGNSGKVITTDGTSASWTNTLTLAGLDLVAPLAVSQGGTSSNNATSARAALSAAKSGANADITALSGLTTPLSVAQGGTGTALITGTGSTVHSVAPTISSPTLTSPALGTPVSGNLTNCAFPTLNQNTTGSSGSCSGNAATATNAINATNGRYIYQNGAYGGAVGYIEPSALHNYYSIYSGTSDNCNGNAATATNATNAYSCSGNAATATTATTATNLSGGSVSATSVTSSGAVSAATTVYSHALDGGTIGAVSVNTGGAFVRTTSDSRLKQQIFNSKLPGLQEVLKIEPRAYKWLEEIESQKENALTRIGFFAQEVGSLIPEAALMNNDGFYSFDSVPVIAALVNAIKEQQVQINQLKALAGI